MVKHTYQTEKHAHTSVIPTQLWIGADDQTKLQALGYLQNEFCTHNACGTCITCMQIKTQQHHAIMWLHPEKNYTREQFEPVMETIAFARTQADPFFIIIQKADYLTIACANSLLKVLEEPPIGYHFILLAQRRDQMLPTIRSRCVEKTIHGAQETFIHQELLAAFTTDPIDPFTLQKVLDQSKIHERESLELLDLIMQFWIHKYREAVAKKFIKKLPLIESHLSILTHAFSYPPMPGSSALFWKNIAAQFIGR